LRRYTADMQTATENKIRKSVEVELSTDRTEQKLLAGAYARSVFIST